MKRTVITALISSGLTAVAIWQLRGAPLASRVLLDNAKVKVTQITYPVGAVRERSVRPADEVIVFVDDCRYQRTDPATGEKTIRERKSGDAIWHNKGEAAPLLKSLSSKPYREVVIELK